MSLYGLSRQVPPSHTSNQSLAEEYITGTKYVVSDVYTPLSNTKTQQREKVLINLEKSRISNEKLANKWAVYSRKPPKK